MAAADSASDNGAPRKSGSLKATLIEFLLVTVIAAGAGVALAMINPPASPAPIGLCGAAKPFSLGHAGMTV